MAEAVKYGTQIKTDKDKLLACYSLVRQMIDEHNRQSSIAASNGHKARFKTYQKEQFEPRLKLLLAERNRLIEKIRWDNYTAQQWKQVGKLSLEEQQAIHDSLFGNKEAEKVKPTLATSPLLDELKAISLDAIGTANPDPYEDFYNDYTEVDPDSHITIAEGTPNKITFTDLSRNEDAYVYRDKGAGHFDGDFEHLLEVYIDIGVAGSTNLHASDMLANVLDDYYDMIMDDEDALSVYELASTGDFSQYLAELDAGSQHVDAKTSLSLDTSYYLTFERDEAVGTYGTIYCYIYSDASRETLVDTLSVTLHTSKKDFRYLYGLNSYNSGVSGTISGYSQNLDLQEAGAETYEKTVSIDALLKGQAEKTVNLDALIKGSATTTVSLDTFIAALGLTKTTDLDALVTALANLKEQFAGVTYELRAHSVQIGDDEFLFFSNQTTCHANCHAKLVKRVYTPSTDSWGSAVTVYDDETYNFYAVAGKIGNDIYLMGALYDWGAEEWHDIGYIKSTDGGDSWGSFVSLSSHVTEDVYHCFGRLTPTSTAGTYLQPWYEFTTSPASYKVRLFKTTDYGANWSAVTIYSGTTKYTEVSIAYCGNSKLIALIRDNDGNYVCQSQSKDNGANWGTNDPDYDNGSVAATNLGAASGVKIPDVLYDSQTDHVIAIYADRSDWTMKIAEVDKDTVFGSPTSWPAAPIIATEISVIEWSGGYPDITKIASGSYFYTYGKENSTSDCDVWGGYYPKRSVLKIVNLDALLRDTDSKTVNLDALVKAIESEQVNLDTLLEALDSKTVDLSVLLKAMGVSETVDLDALLEAVGTKTVSLDALFKALGVSETVDLDAILGGIGTQTVDLDALLKGIATQTVNVDSLLRALDTETVDLDVVLKLVGSQTISLDALLKALGIPKTVALDTILGAAGIQTVDIDALLRGQDTTTVTLDSLIKALDKHEVSVDALLRGTATSSANLDLLISALGEQNISLDALLVARILETVSVDALLRDTGTKTVPLDAYLKAINLVESVNLDMLIRYVGLSKTAILDALLRDTDSKTISLSALLRATGISTISLDTMLLLTGEKSVTLDSILKGASATSVALDVILEGAAQSFDIVVVTSQYRDARAITSMKRKISTILTGG